MNAAGAGHVDAGKGRREARPARSAFGLDSAR